MTPFQAIPSIQSAVR